MKIADWQAWTERRARKIVELAHDEWARAREPRWSLHLTLVGAPSMTRLNVKYRGKRYPTDVLSFPAPQPFRAGGHLGELVICLPTAKRQARELGHATEFELEVLLVHGILHLLGYDHEKGPAQARRMARIETQLLQRLSSKRQANGRKKVGLIDRANSGI